MNCDHTASFRTDDRYEILRVCSDGSIDRHDVIGFGIFVDKDDDGEETGRSVHPYVLDPSGDVLPFRYSDHAGCSRDECWGMVRRGAEPPEWLTAEAQKRAAAPDDTEEKGVK